MPLSLDGCITGIFVPGNIGASSGQTPIVHIMPPRAPGTFAVQVHEVVAAADSVSSPRGPLAASVNEAASAIDTLSASVTSIITAAVSETAAATDVVGVSVVGAGFNGVLGMDGPIMPANPAPTIIYIET